MRKIRIKAILFIVPAVIISVILIISIFFNRNTERLIKAIEQEDIAAISTLMENGVDPNKTDVYPGAFWSFFETTANRPLAIACNVGNVEVVKLLIEHGATAENVEYTGWSPLRETLFYCQPDDVEIVKLLLENGADPDFKEDDLPVFIAAKMQPKKFDKHMTNGTVFANDYDNETAVLITEIVKLLLGEKSVNIKGSQDKTLLISACEVENKHLVEYLLSKGCDTSAKDSCGKTALDYATETGNEEIIDLLS